MSFFEIIVLPNGDIALKSDNDVDEPLICISFSKKVQGFSEESKIDVARVMIDAGIDLFDKMDLDVLQVSEENHFAGIPPVIH
jgi:hypothetical protein|tara:strand:- start:3670 stop:3918 length:249 start_codon:yes stop_codon:yes gene_type:complete